MADDTIADIRAFNRFYTAQIGLLAEPPRTESGQRRYGPAEVDRLNFIRHARELGFEVNDIRELLAIDDGGDVLGPALADAR